VSTFAISQDFHKISKAEFASLEDYKKAEPDVLKVANFLFNTPNKPETYNRAVAFAYILKWMEGTDAYTFSIGEEAMKVTKGNQDLLGMYFAGLTKTALDHPEKKLSDTEMHEKTTQLLAQYCADKSNKLKPNKALKKEIKKMKKE
jgi:hypothetical protein